MSEMEYVDVDYKHPLSWRINRSGPPTSLGFISPVEPRSLRSTKGIKVTKHKRDKDWLQMFILTEDEYVGNFALFCKDMVESTRGADPKNGPSIVEAEYQRWKGLFKQIKAPLEKAQIQGLMGEMIILRDVIIPRYGEEMALNSWTGPFGKEQDFQGPDIWYEVKTISNRRNTVKITSLDQLDRDDRGRLVIVRMRDGPGVSLSRITINDVYRSLMDRLSTTPRLRFMAALENIGFKDSEEYDEYGFEILSITEYEVEEGFPRICRSRTDKGISNAEYEINLDIIYRYEVR